MLRQLDYVEHLKYSNAENEPQTAIFELFELFMHIKGSSFGHPSLNLLKHQVIVAVNFLLISCYPQLHAF